MRGGEVRRGERRRGQENNCFNLCYLLLFDICGPVFPQ